MAFRPRHIGSALLIVGLLLGTELASQPVEAAPARSAASPRLSAATATWAWVVSRKLSGSWIPARHDRIERTTLPQRVGVRCFDLAGQPRDTRFTLAYAR